MIVFKWIDGFVLMWVLLYVDLWKDGGIFFIDVIKVCIKMEWGFSFFWKDYECVVIEDFFCEGKNVFFVFNRVFEGNIGEMLVGGC